MVILYTESSSNCKLSPLRVIMRRSVNERARLNVRNSISFPDGFGCSKKTNFKCSTKSTVYNINLNKIFFLVSDQPPVYGKY